MKILYKLGTLIVLGCSIWVSFNHTLDLYWAGHFRNGLEWPATITAEVAFLMGVLMLFDSRRQGYSPPWQAKMLFVIGLAVVGWSNVSAGIGYEKSGKATGVILGLLIPVFIFGAESVLSHAYMRKRKKNTHAHTDSHTADESHSVRDTHTDSHKESHTQSHTHTARDSHIVSHTESRKLSHADSHTHTLAQTESHTQSRKGLHTSSHTNEQAHNDEGSHTHAQALADTSDVREPREESHTDSQAHTESHAHTESRTDSHTQSLTHTDSHADSRKETHTVSQSNTDSQSQKEPHTESQKESNKGSHTDVQTERAKYWAKLLYEQDGKYPSIRKLAEVAGCSEWNARKVLAELNPKKKKKVS